MPQDSLSQLHSGQLAGARELTLRCGLRELPTALLDLADTLEVLDLSGNQLTALPDWFCEFKRLRILFASSNPFTVLPEVLGSLPRISMVGFKANQIVQVPAVALAPTLRWLILTDNRVEVLPDCIGDCAPMEKLMLAGNRLRQLPETLARCESLALLRISANQFEALPEWLLAMPRLSWLACAGNPFNAQAESQALVRAQASAISWDALTLQAVLGEGASGHIHAASWHRHGVVTQAAYKRFKGSMTSDGLPHSELAASLAAGTHPNLVGALGLVSGQPEGDQGVLQGLLMTRLPEGSRVLADPPSRASCSRDVYAPDCMYTPAQALRIASGVAAAVVHLHARGMLHGDLYAHNTHWNDQGEVMLGDFGAASFLPADTRVAEALMKHEVRALGCLIEELGQRLVPEAKDLSTLLLALAADCMQPVVSQRPMAAEVWQRLQALA